MNVAGWRFLLFAVVGASAIILLAAIGVPSSEREEVDRYTGERRTVVRTLADIFHEARDAGDVQLALERLEKRLPDFPKEPVLLRLKAILQGEFAGREAKPPEHHPAAALWNAELARASDAAAELKRRLRERIPKEPVLALLNALQADEAQSEAIESYFASLVHLRPERPPDQMGADEMAARAGDFGSYIALARAFELRGRQRARMRWLLRAYATTDTAFEPLYKAYVAAGRVVEAFHLLGARLAGNPNDLEAWKRRATVAGWLNLPRAELEAQEILFEHLGGRDRRKRLIDLYTYVGRPVDAVPHALALVKGSTDRDELFKPVKLALEGGNLDLALRLLTELAEQSDDSAHWRELIIRYAEQDMRIERMIAEYKWLAQRYPERDYEKRLERLYRRTARTEDLADLLAKRLEKEPDNRPLEDEVIGLHVALNHPDRVKGVVQRRVDRAVDPLRFFRELKLYRVLGIEGLVARGRAMATSPALLRTNVQEVLNLIREMPDKEWRDIATIIAHRYYTEPAARAHLIENVDLQPDDAARAKAAAALFRKYPHDKGLLKVWIERSGWAGNLPGELDGRERLLTFEPDNAENRRALADLYGATNEPAKAVVHWRWLTRREGLRSKAALRLIDTLFATGEVDEAIEWLEKRAHLPDATVEEQLEVADQLFGTERLDRALRFYMAVLESDPEHAQALLRAGLIRSWTNDPRGAIPFLERRLEVSAEADAEVRFYLGEAYWAIQHASTARKYHLRALRDLEADTPNREIMRAKMLARLGRIDEAVPLFDKILKDNPRNVDLLLDYVDAMIGVERAEKARALVDQAKLIDPRRARVVRTDGKVALLERRYEDAAKILGEAATLYGPEAGTESERGRALELAGEPRAAYEAYRRSLALQPDNRDVEQSLLRAWDRVATILHANFEYRRTSNDWLLRTWAEGSKLLENNDTRLGVALGVGSYSGRSSAVDGGATPLTETIPLIRFAGNHRLQRLYTLGAGVDLFPGAPGNVPIGAWVDVVLPHLEPYWVVGARLYGNTLFDDPMAAVSFGGRSSGLSVLAHGDLTGRLWGVFEANFQSITLTVPDVSDERVDATVAVGYRILEGETRVGERLVIDRSTLPGLIGPDLSGDPALTRGPLWSVWLSYRLIRLFGDQALTGFIPIGTDFDYLSLGTRADFHLAPGLGAKVEAHIGTDLRQSEPFFGVEAGVTWRPSQHLELTLLGFYGRALQRAGNENSFDARFYLSYRW